MLVLTRKCSEMIRIGDDIVVKVIKTGKSTVKIGVEAPNDVRVLRAELCEETPRPPKTDTVNFAHGGGAPLNYACSDQYPHAV